MKPETREAKNRLIGELVDLYDIYTGHPTDENKRTASGFAVECWRKKVAKSAMAMNLAMTLRQFDAFLNFSLLAPNPNRGTAVELANGDYGRLLEILQQRRERGYAESDVKIEDGYDYNKGGSKW